MSETDFGAPSSSIPPSSIPPSSVPPVDGADGSRSPSTIAALLDRLSKTKINARLGLVSDVLISVALVALAEAVYRVPMATASVAVLTGLVLFTLLEYAFHRWLFHGTLKALAEGHWQHHLAPLGHDALPFFLPPLIAVLLAFALALVLRGGIAFLFVGGLAAGYALYGISHIVIHIRRFTLAGPRRWAGAHHIHHHHPDKNFGVTTPLWDFVLGTRYVTRSANSVAQPTPDWYSPNDRR